MANADQGRGKVDASADFAEHVHGTAYRALSESVVAATKRSIADTIGVMLAGSTTASAQGLVRMLSRWGGAADATVLGHPVRLSAPHAAFANGAFAHQFDFDDIHDEAVVHPTANSLSAGLAVAEAEGGRSGMDLLRAVAIGNDVACRLGLAIEGKLYDYPWTRPPVVGTFGAAAAASAMLQLAPDAIQSAFGLTLHQACNTLECLYAPGSDVRGLRDGFSARAGVTAAYMAQEGICGDGTSLEGRFGLYQAFFRGEYSRDVLTRDLGRKFEGAEVSVKPWPSARETHATIHAALELLQANHIGPDEIASVTLGVGPTNLEFCEPAAIRRRPPNRMDALSSLPYAVAVALCYGGVPLSAYVDAELRDARVLQMAERVTWQMDLTRHEGTIEGGRVTIRLKDGRTFAGSARHGLGHPDNPLSPALIRRKFMDCVRLLPSPPAPELVEALLQVVDSLEHHSVADLTRALGRIAR